MGNMAERLAEFNIGKGSDKFKFQEGDNYLRVMSDFEAIENDYEGKKSIKFMFWVWSNKDSAIKLAFWSRTLAQQIAELQDDKVYGFSEFPMPYDLNIKAKNAGTIDVEYTIIPARENTPPTQEQLAALKAEKPLSEVKDAINKNKSEPPTVSTTEENVEDTLNKAAPNFLK